jgi:beta-glucanase (GH16 family)
MRGIHGMRAAVKGVVVVFALALSITLSGPAQAARRVLFYEPFTTALASSKWNIEDYGPGGYQACCLTRWNQYYTSANVYTSGGALRLVAGADYHSGAVTTEGKFGFRYGTLSIRAKLPKGPGLWPALWLLPDTHPAAGQLAGSEIDLMEELGRDPHTVYFTVWQGTSHVGCHFSGPDFSAAYHTYTLNWSPGRAQWLIDGVTHCTLWRDVSNQAMFLLMNVAIGRPDNWGGAPTAATHFPQEMDVKWVRVTG